MDRVSTAMLAQYATCQPGEERDKCLREDETALKRCVKTMVTGSHHEIDALHLLKDDPEAVLVQNESISQSKVTILQRHEGRARKFWFLGATGGRRDRRSDHWKAA